jgi:hypothetical protein
MGFAQLLADGNTHPVAFRTVFPSIEHQITIRRTLGVIQPLKNVIQFQRTRKSHKKSSLTGAVDGTDCRWGCERFWRKSRLKTEGILCVFRGLHNAELQQKIRRTSGKLFRRHALVKRERGEFHIHPAVAPVSLMSAETRFVVNPRSYAHQADRTLRPLARRRARTLRPLEVAIL